MMGRIFESVLAAASSGFGMWQPGEAVETDFETIGELKDHILETDDEVERIEPAPEISGSIYDQNGREPYKIVFRALDPDGGPVIMHVLWGNNGILRDEPIEAEAVTDEAQTLIDRLDEIIDDLERALEHGAEGIATLLEGQFGIDNILNDILEVSTYKLRKAVEYYRAEQN